MKRSRALNVKTGRELVIGEALTALTIASSGHVAVIAAATEAPQTFTPWVQGGGAAAAVAGLVYVARMIVKGDLVPRAVAQREAEMGAAIRHQAERESQLLTLVDEAQAREKVYANLCNDMARTAGELGVVLREMKAERP